MRPSLGQIALFLLLPVGIGVSTYFVLRPKSTPPTDSSPFPVAVFTDFLDMGTVEPGYHPVMFDVENRGAQDLELSSFEVACGCMILSDGESLHSNAVTKITIPPKQSQRLFLHVTIRDRSDKLFQTKFAFRTNDPNHPIATVGVQARLRGYISSEPTKVVLGSCRPGEIIEQTISLRDHEESPPRTIGRIESSNPERVQIVSYLPATPAERVRLQDERLIGQVRLSIKVPDRDSVDETITIHDAKNDQPRLSIPIQATAIQLFTISPSTVSLPRMVEGRPTYSAQLICRSNNDLPFQLEVLDRSGLQVRISQGSKPSLFLVDIECLDANVPVEKSFHGKVTFRAIQGGKNHHLDLSFSIRPHKETE